MPCPEGQRSTLLFDMLSLFARGIVPPDPLTKCGYRSTCRPLNFTGQTRCSTYVPIANGYLPSVPVALTDYCFQPVLSGYGSKEVSCFVQSI